MNPDPQPRDPQPWPRTTTVSYSYDNAGRLTPVHDPARPAQEPPPMPAEPLPQPGPAPFDWEHDREKGIFRITWPDGQVEVFRDKPVRHLVVEPDAQTGEMKPVVQRGRPTYLYLAREEREVR